MRCPLRSLVHFLIRLFVFLLLSFKCSLYILDNSLLSDMSLANIFSERIFHLKIGKSRKKSFRGFPGGAVVESLPAGAGDMGSSPGLGGTHMPRSGWAREPQLLSLRVWSLCSATGEAAMVRDPRTVMRGGPRLPRLGKALAQRRGLNTAINE